MLFSTAPIYDDLETVKLADSLSMYMELAAAPTTPLVGKVLAGKSPRERAAELIAGHAAEGRRTSADKLAEGGLNGHRGLATTR